MVCVPCIVIPFVLWFFHKYIRPLIAKFWPWKQVESATSKENETTKNGEVVQNGHVDSKSNRVTAGTPSEDGNSVETKKDK